MSKKVFVKTYGCQMNVYDSERMGDVLAAEGYRATDEAADADLVILNTCHIREKAAEKVYSELGRIRRLKRVRRDAGKDTLIAVAGCVAQAEGAEILRRAPGVDLVFGPQTYHRLPDLIARRAATGRAVIETEFPAEDKFEGLAPRRAAGKTVSAFLTVQEGCDKFCTFCVVPYTRGAEFSRAPAQIEAEARALAAAGVRELTLLGQNVNAYHGGSLSLAGLVARLSQIDGIVRLRYMTSHPRDMTDDLIEAHGANPKLMPFLHLPVQAGSDRVLKAMNRGHGADHYIRLVERIRSARPGLALSGDFIVGFPGETEADFRLTLDLVREVRYASGYSFKYSPRPGTPAAEDGNQVPDEVKLGRLHELQPGRRPGQMAGRSPYLQSVHLMAQNLVAGQVVEAHIDGIGTNSLSGHCRDAA